MIVPAAERYAAVALNPDRTLFQAFEANDDAERERDVLLGDDHYRDREPFVAAGSATVLRRVGEADERRAS